MQQIMRRRRPQTSSMFIVSVNGTDFTFLNDYRFTKFSGIKDRTVMIPYVNPFLHREFSVPTIRKYDPVTLEMPYNTLEHNQIFTRWNQYENQALTIQIEPVVGCQVQGEETSIGYAHNLYGAIWNKCETAEVSRNDNRITMLTIGFTFTRTEEIEV